MCSIVSYAFFVLFFIYNTNSSSNIAIKLTPNSSVSIPAEYEHHQKKKNEQNVFYSNQPFSRHVLFAKKTSSHPTILRQEKKNNTISFSYIIPSHLYMWIDRQTLRMVSWIQKNSHKRLSLSLLKINKFLIFFYKLNHYNLHYILFSGQIEIEHISK